MKKIFIILSLFILCSCERTSILNTVYISSIGLDYIDGEYIGYFYSPPARDIGKDDNTDEESTVYVLKEKEFVNLFDNMFDSDPANINMFHLKTMILSESFKDIDLLLDYFKYSTRLSYNFHLFITQDKLSDIYEYKSMGSISNLYNFLNSPSLIDYDEHGASKCHFLQFANSYCNEFRYVMIPLVSIEYNSLKEEEFQLKLTGYSNTNYIYENEEYKGLNFLFKSDKLISNENNICLITKYEIDMTDEEVFTFNISYKSINISGILDVENYILHELSIYLDKVIEQEGSLFFINQYNYLYNKNLDITEYSIKIKKA